MFIRIIGFCLGLACAPAYAASIKMEKVTLDSFNELVKGHTWQSSWNKSEIKFANSGKLTGKADGKMTGKIKGNWTFDKKKGFCRDAKIGKISAPNECQKMFLIGEKVLVIQTKSNPKGIAWIRVK